LLIVILLKETKKQQMLLSRLMTNHLILLLKAMSTNCMEIWTTVKEKRTLLASTKLIIQFSFVLMWPLVD
jgi:hypothetical protein